MKMNEKVKALWINALESETYKQGKGALRLISPEGSLCDEYCCLGVLTELFIKEHPGTIFSKVSAFKGKKVMEYSYKNEETKSLTGSKTLLPLPVMKWAEISEFDPIVSYGNTPINISTLNDNDIDFKEIASIIRNQL